MVGTNLDYCAVYVPKVCPGILEGDSRAQLDICEMLYMCVIERLRLCQGVCCQLFTFKGTALPLWREGAAVRWQCVLYRPTVQFLCRGLSIFAGWCVAVL